MLRHLQTNENPPGCCCCVCTWYFWCFVSKSRSNYMFLAFRLDFRLGAVYHRRQKQLVNTKKTEKYPGATIKWFHLLSNYKYNCFNKRFPCVLSVRTGLKFYVFIFRVFPFCLARLRVTLCCGFEYVQNDLIREAENANISIDFSFWSLIAPNDECVNSCAAVPFRQASK